MKYSVLLPTRNGGIFLENCIQSILDQGYFDMELIISDNANNDTTQDVINRFRNDPRVSLLRLNEPVCVTDNWNNALNAAKGEYILMMGDDDYLMPNYFHKIDKLITKYNYPDCILYNGYSYVAPDSIEHNKQSYYSLKLFNFGKELSFECYINKLTCINIVKDMFRFLVRIPLNMQTTIFSRKSFDRIGGIFIQPFPDHYALNALLLTSSNWVFTPERLVIVGVSPKSFGHYVYSNKQTKGLEYLGVKNEFNGRLPGNELLNGMYSWLLQLKQNYPEILTTVKINRNEYVKRQVYAWFLQLKLNSINIFNLINNLKLLTILDWIGMTKIIFDLKSWTKFFGLISFKRNKNSAETQWNSLRKIENICNIKEFAYWLEKNEK